MGRRKDRMLAAMSNAGRRVKLDLSAEPSGDLGGSSGHDEVGKDMETKERAGLPKSPTSSGQPQNPLLLLGQYSDDEIDEESNDRLKQAVMENPPADDNSQGTEGHEDKDATTGEDHAAQEVKKLDKDGNVTSADGVQKPEVYDTRENDATTSSDHPHEEMNLAEQASVAETSAVQVFGDVSSGWKMVLHEDSNRYYYWNIETGETSWEVPQVLVQTTESTLDQKATVDESMQTAMVALQESDSTMAVELNYYSTQQTINGSVGPSMISHNTAAYECVPQMEEKVEEGKIEDLGNENRPTDVSQTELNNAGGAIVASLGDGREIHIDGSLTNEESKMAFDLSSDLVKWSELLLEKLKSLEVSKGHDWTSKYLLEVEVRLSDIKSLSSYGSSLLPFWLHSERQLKMLEGAIDEKIYQIAKSQVDEVMATHISSCIEEDKSQLGQELQADGNQNNAIPSASVISNVSSNVEKPMVVLEGMHNEASFGIAVSAENFAASGSLTENLQSDSIVGEQVNGPPFPESIPKPALHGGEDVDMDVDMEVEDASPAGNTSIEDASVAKDFTSEEQQLQSNPIAEYPSLPSEDPLFVPPPPDEEWIPPPPPDNEQVPPPPPDEPPVPSYTSTTTFIGTGQPLPYMEQYNASYPNSSFTYYGHTVTEVPSSNFYVHADGTPVDVSHAQMYYGVVPSTYNGTAPVVVNPVESVAYYGHQDGTIPSLSVAGSIESSQNYSESVPAHDSNLASGQIGSIDSLPEEGEIVNADVSAVRETDTVSQATPSTSEAAQAPSNTLVKESVSALSANAVASAAANATTSSTTKAQSKVRNKKRTVAVAPSLRSNKKVSSLVDKWKAAKEELNENEEDEPENAYEILERKRQREIEEWRAQQIASGEAKDNANFQPLGGDWREKVKRRRAQAAKEAAKSSLETLATQTTKTSPETKPDTNKQPNLVDLSRNLPTGWQAYWDETSKQVYYGNTITSETTWTKPSQ